MLQSLQIKRWLIHPGVHRLMVLLFALLCTFTKQSAAAFTDVSGQVPGLGLCVAIKSFNAERKLAAYGYSSQEKSLLINAHLPKHAAVTAIERVELSDDSNSSTDDDGGVDVFGEVHSSLNVDPLWRLAQVLLSDFAQHIPESPLAELIRPPAI